MEGGHVHGEAVLGVELFATELAVVLEELGKVDALHMVDHVGLVHVTFAAQCAHVLGPTLQELTS